MFVYHSTVFVMGSRRIENMDPSQWTILIHVGVRGTGPQG